LAKHLFVPQGSSLALPEGELNLIRYEKSLQQMGFFGAHDPRAAAKAAKAAKIDNAPLTHRKVVQWVNRDNKRIQVSAEFRCSLGLPSTSDRDKFMAFMRIALDQKRKYGHLSNPIRFTAYHILSVMGLTPSGANYDDLNTWGQRMADTTITSEQIIYSATRKMFMNETVHVFRKFARSGESDKSGVSHSIEFVVHLEDWLLDNINQGYVIPEDYTLYLQLVRPVAKGIYGFLYIWFFANKGKEVEKNYEELCALLNISCYKHRSKIKETMGKSLDELIALQCLTKWEIGDMKTKSGFKVILHPGKAILDVLKTVNTRNLPAPATPKETSLTEGQDAIKALLIARGVVEAKALSMSKENQLDVLRDQIDYLDSEISKGNILNPAGFIISFITDKKVIPVTYETLSQRQEREQRHQEALRRQEEASSARAKSQMDELRYMDWRRDQADKAIQERFSEEDLEDRLREIRKALSKDPERKRSLDYMPSDIRREQLMQFLRKEVALELDLCSFEEWCEANPQTELFEL
jgi:hypothetical protein